MDAYVYPNSTYKRVADGTERRVTFDVTDGLIAWEFAKDVEGWLKAATNGFGSLSLQRNTRSEVGVTYSQAFHVSANQMLVRTYTVTDIDEKNLKLSMSLTHEGGDMGCGIGQKSPCDAFIPVDKYSKPDGSYTVTFIETGFPIGSEFRCIIPCCCLCG